MKLTYILILTFGVIISATSQQVNTQKLDSLFNTLGEKNKAMGSIAITKNDKVLYSKAIGYASISEKEKIAATEKTKYRIGSITKMFTAVMIFQLIEDKVISLNTTLELFFPSIPNTKKITIENLLNHRSGIHNFTDDEVYGTYMTQPKTEEEMITIIAANKPDFEPNEKAAYSNSNFLLLGYIIEKLTYKTYAQNLNDRITSKIGLKDTYVGGKIKLQNNESYSYAYQKAWIQETETDMSVPGGAGAIVSTPLDLDKFITALFSNKLITSENLLKMKTMTDNYGMAMFQMPFNSHIGYGHNGGIDGFGSTLAYFPEDSLAISFCSNGLTYDMNSIMIGVLSIYFNLEYIIPSFPISTFKPENLDIYTGIYSSNQIPLKITISISDDVLMAQATGQPAFPLEPSEKDSFHFDRAGVELIFTPEKKEMVLKQGGGTYLFKKE